MFQSVRWRLTLWYCGLLAVVLVAFSAVSYLRIARAIRAETDASLAETARELSAAFSHEDFEESGATRDVPLDFRYSDRVLLIFRTDGGLVASSRLPGVGERIRSEIARRILGGERGFFTVDRRGSEPVRAFATPLVVVSARFIAVVARGLGDERRRLADAGAALFFGIPVALLVAGFGGYVLARYSLAPVIRMSRQAERIGASSLAERIDVRNPRDELGILATTLNELLARLEAAFASQRRFMADASHELRTPVSILQGEADVALSRADRTADEYRDALQVVQKTSQKLAQIVKDLFLLSRADADRYPVRRSRFYLDETVAECARAMRTIAESRGIEIRMEPVPETLVFADEELIRRMVLNLLDNAMKYTRRHGVVRVTLSHRDGVCVLAVQDEGPGIPGEDRARIFERFFRSSPAAEHEPGQGGGAGLGLAIARWIAQLHGGEVQLRETSPSGSTFVAEIRADPADADSDGPF
jgi:heavy metal sensor kinase